MAAISKENYIWLVQCCDQTKTFCCFPQNIQLVLQTTHSIWGHGTSSANRRIKKIINSKRSGGNWMPWLSRSTISLANSLIKRENKIGLHISPCYRRRRHKKASVRSLPDLTSALTTLYIHIIAWYTFSSLTSGCVPVQFLRLCPLKGGRGCLMSPPCLESQGCHLIPLCDLLSCSSA